MKKREAGQAFILVLILLAIGAMLVVPMLQLAFAASKGSQIVTQNLKGLYAAEGGQDYVMWKLLDPEYIASFTYNGDSDEFSVDICGIPVNVTIVMWAEPSWRGVILATDDVIKPTKSVSPNTNDGSSQTYTYTIRLEQISDNTSQGLDAVYDVLPDAFMAPSLPYVTGSSRLSVDGGTPQPIADPARQTSGYGGQVRLRWPASGNFSSDPASPNYFYGIRDFYPDQVKELSFQVTGAMGPNTRNYNWVVLAPWNTLSGAQAPITRGTGAGPRNGLLDVFKTADKLFILPNVTTPVSYTITIQNQQQSVDKIEQIDDYLPPGFSYTNGSTGGITTSNPQYQQLETINGIDRWHLRWTFSPAQSIASGETRQLTFAASAFASASGSYYNEMVVIPSNPLPKIFSDLGLTYLDFNSAYTWNSGPVIVPAYDSETEALGKTIDTHLLLTVGNVLVSSWQVQ